MIKDPYWERESQKYKFPIPSRECILALLARKSRPLRYEDIAKTFKLKTRDKNSLHRRLRAMERDGQIIFTRSRRYALPKHLDIVEGLVIGHSGGYGFLRVYDAEKHQEDLFLNSEQMKKVMHGDVALAQVWHADSKGRKEAKIIKLLQEANRKIVGRYFNTEGASIVIPEDKRIPFNIYIPKKGHKANNGDIVAVEILERPSQNFKASGKIVEVLGDSLNGETATDMALYTLDIPFNWPKKVINYTNKYIEKVKTDISKRVDLRNIPLVTIDSEDAKDFDDAVFCAPKKSGGFRLIVAIADVSHYVKSATCLDKEACLRGNSIYFPTRVVPMLPEILSNDLCSLKPNVDRLCMVCDIKVSAKGRISAYKFYEAIICSKARLTYNKVHRFLKGKKQDLDLAVVENIKNLHALYKILNKEREHRGALALETIEPKFLFDKDGKISQIIPIVRNDAHKIIEESMILANVAAAKFLKKHKVPSLFRVHEGPSLEQIKSLRQVLQETGLSLSDINIEPTPKDYANLITKIANRPDKDFLYTLILRSLKPAVYTANCKGHFGLSLKEYTHFTSPIRRYPDLIVHRCIKSILNNKKSPFEEDNVELLGQHCSMTERRAEEASRQVVEYFRCEFMQNKVGETFKGQIVGVTAFGLFVRLQEFLVEGLVHVVNIKEHVKFDGPRQKLVSASKEYKLGDWLIVQVVAVNLEEHKIHLTIVSEEKSNKK